MAFHNTMFWEIVLNIIAFFACLIVIWGLIRLKRKSGRASSPVVEEPAPEAFDDVVRDEFARQTSPDASPSMEEPPDPAPAPTPLVAEEIVEPSEDMYDTAKRLAATGLTAEEIMAETHLLRSEIDLIMKLKEYGG